MTNDFRDKFAIVGAAHTPTTRTHAEGRTSQELEAWAVKLALEDAGLQRDVIDGAIRALGNQESDSYSRKLGLKPSFYYPIGRAASTVASLFFATQALATGNATFVCISLGLTHYTQSRAPGGTRLLSRDGAGLVDLGWSSVPGGGAIHALYASRHMHEFGTTEEQLGHVALAHRAWANLNPEARFYERKMTMDDYLGSRWVVHPLRLFDHCVTSDVGCAVIVTTAERAKDLRKDPVYIKGIGFGDAGRESFWDQSNFTRTDAGHAKDVAFKQAGITIGDVDVAEMYDCFTPEMILFVEDYGFCEKGEGGPFFESGATAPGGKHPMNTHGGLLSAYHCTDGGNVVEAVTQLRGEAGDRQVEGAEIAVANGHGGELILPYMLPIHGTAVLGNKLS
jgi:acetyl-CoA acetyltransferase